MEDWTYSQHKQFVPVWNAKVDDSLGRLALKEDELKALEKRYKLDEQEAFLNSTGLKEFEAAQAELATSPSNAEVVLAHA